MARTGGMMKIIDENPSLMNLLEAIKSKRKIKRHEWDDSMWLEQSADNKDGVLLLQFVNGLGAQFAPHIADMLAEDWEVSREPRRVWILFNDDIEGRCQPIVITRPPMNGAFVEFVEVIESSASGRSKE